MSRVLKKVAAERNLTVFKNIAYGDMNGFFVTLCDGVYVAHLVPALNLSANGGNYISCVISLSYPNETAQESVFKLFEDANARSEYRIQAVSYDAFGVRLIFPASMKIIERIRAFLDWSLPALKALGAQGSDHCCVCGLPLGPEDACVKNVNFAAYRMHEKCVEHLNAVNEQRQEDAKITEHHYLKGTIGAIAGGLVGAIPWAIVYSLGWFVALLGFVIGWLAKKGYELLGGMPGRAKAWIIVIVSLLSVVFAQFLGDAIMLYQAVAQGELLIAYGQIPEVLILLLGDSQYLIATLWDIFLGWLFAFLGLYGIIKEARQEHKPVTFQISDLH